MDQWLREHFSPIGENQVVLYDDGEGGQIGYDPSDPAGMFSSITTTPPTYAALSALPCASQGWQKVFDQWQSKGLVA